MREIDEIHTPLLLLRDDIRRKYIDFGNGGGRFQGYREGLMFTICLINDMLDIATLGDFDGCKTEPIPGEFE